MLSCSTRKSEMEKNDGVVRLAMISRVSCEKVKYGAGMK